MTIDEAIKRLKNIHSELSTPGRQNDWTAILLGIEALKREEVWRQNDPGGTIHLLPGETEK